MEIKSYLLQKRQLVEEYMTDAFPGTEGLFAQHIEAMRYSLFVGGKRVRPILCLAAAETVSEDENILQKVLPIACALECIHTYSLIHDDLPAMDNDDLRRGKPTNHTVYGEASAILAGDGLLTYAFEHLGGRLASVIPAENALRIIEYIARAAGMFGMVGGQHLDIINEGKKISHKALQLIHKNKTGALITASVLSGGMAADASETQLKSLNEYGNNIGLAFQIADDVLDIESTTEELGKPVGSDIAAHKVTYPSLFGLNQSKQMGYKAVEKAHLALSIFDHRADPLRDLATFIIERTN